MEWVAMGSVQMTERARIKLDESLRLLDVPLMFAPYEQSTCWDTSD